MKTIKLTKGYEAIVDDELFDWLNQWKWNVRDCGVGRYAQRTRPSDHTNLQMHRVILGAKPGEIVDHINGNGLDNRRCNLRLCSQAENTRNRKKSQLSRSKFKGVLWSESHQKWRARIAAGNRRVHLGWFLTEIEAARAYNYAALRLHGQFAKLNETEEF